MFKNLNFEPHILLKKLSEISYLVFVAIKVSVHTYIFPGHKSLTMLLYAVSILTLSLLGYFFNLAYFIDWRGAAVAVVFLSILYLMGRRNN